MRIKKKKNMKLHPGNHVKITSENKWIVKKQCVKKTKTRWIVCKWFKSSNQMWKINKSLTDESHLKKRRIKLKMNHGGKKSKDKS